MQRVTYKIENWGEYNKSLMHPLWLEEGLIALKINILNQFTKLRLGMPRSFPEAA